MGCEWSPKWALPSAAKMHIAPPPTRQPCLDDCTDMVPFFLFFIFLFFMNLSPHRLSLVGLLSKVLQLVVNHLAPNLPPRVLLHHLPNVSGLISDLSRPRPSTPYSMHGMICWYGVHDVK